MNEVGADPGATAARPAVGYGRVLLKISGEALLGERQYGVDPAFCAFIAGQVAAARAAGVEVGIVVGGGNIFRGRPPPPGGWTGRRAITSG